MTRCLLALGLELALFSFPVVAQDSWLDLGLGGRPLAQGGAVTATVEGPEAVAWNPAGLADSDGLILLVGLAPVSDLGTAWLGGLSWGRNGWGVGIAGELDGITSFYTAGIGLRFSELIALGLAVHRLSAAEEVQGVDLGVLMRLLGLRLGLNFVNLIHDPGLTPRTRAGLRVDLSRVTVTGELDFREGGPWGWGFGAEVRLLQPFVLILGLADWGGGLGLGFASERLGITFAFVRASAEGWFLSTAIRI